MASTNKTSKLKLNKWLGTDKIQRVDFNNDNDIIEQEFLDRGINVKWFGAKGDGVTDDTSAFRDALNFAEDNNVKKVKMSNGRYLLTSYDASTVFSSVLAIPQGVTLEGEGYQTELIVNPSNITSNGAFRLFMIRSFAHARNFRINGQKDLINRSGITEADFVGILAENNQTDFSFKDIWVHDIFGVAKESFGVMCNRGSKRVKFENITGWNVEGTAVHVAGDYLNNNMAEDVDVINCITYNNTWMGISTYGAKNVRIYNHQSYGNLKNGLNFEWCSDIDVYNCKSYNNGRSGYMGYGKASFRLHNCRSIGNNTTNQDWIGEITLHPDSWWTGEIKGTAGIIEINDCKVEPLNLSESKHIVIGADNTINIGNKLPDSVTIKDSGVENWKIVTRDFNGVTFRSTASFPNIYYKGFNVSQPLLLENLGSFTYTSNLTSQQYTGAGNISSNARTLTGITVQYGNGYSKYILKPNRLYHIAIRYKPESINKWVLLARDSTSTDPIYSIILTGDDSFVGQWKTAEGLFKTGSNEQRVQIQYDGTTFPDNLHVDYIIIKEILNNSNSTNALYDFIQIGANKIIQGNSMPTTGTWSKGDICYNTNPTPLGTAGSKYIIHGWQRITDGSNNVLNTDWVEMRYLTGQ